MRESDLIDSYPPWVQYYAPLLNDQVSEKYPGIRLDGTAKFLTLVGPKVADSFGLAAEDVDQLATRANLDAWAALEMQYLDVGRGAPDHPGAELHWQPDWFAVPQQRERADDNFDGGMVLDGLLSDPTYTTLTAEEFGQLVAALLWVLDMYGTVIELVHEGYDTAVTRQKFRDRRALTDLDGPSRADMDSDEFSNDEFIAMCEEYVSRTQFAHICLTGLGAQIKTTDTAAPAIAVHASVTHEIEGLLTDVDDDLDAVLTEDPTEDKRWTLAVPGAIAAALQALSSVHEREPASRQHKAAKQRASARQTVERPHHDGG